MESPELFNKSHSQKQYNYLVKMTWCIFYGLVNSYMQYWCRRVNFLAAFSGGSRISERRDSNRKSGDANLLYWPIFPKNYMKIKLFELEGGSSPRRPPPGSANDLDVRACAFSQCTSVLSVGIFIL